MKRRNFLKTGLGMGGAWMLKAFPSLPLHFLNQEEAPNASLSPGDLAPAAAFVFDKSQQPYTIRQLCAREPAAKITLLYIFGGRVPKPNDRLGGIWCVDSFEDLHILRYLNLKYDSSQLRILPVACAPVYSSQNYGFEPRVFLDEPDDSPKFKESAAAFVKHTEKLFVEGYLPVPSYYDVRYRLLFNRREDLQPGAGYGPIYDWQGKFRGKGETQRYGTPTIWLLNSNGKVLSEPFWGNLYHSEPFEIRYTIVDVDRAVEQNLQR